MTELARSESNDYASLQRKLRLFAAAMDAGCEALAKVQLDMKLKASLASVRAQQLDDADGDEKYVDLTSSVSTMLSGAAVATQRTRAAGEEAARAARHAAAAHRAKYGGLHGIRSSRKTKTPKPGFFEE